MSERMDERFGYSVPEDYDELFEEGLELFFAQILEKVDWKYQMSEIMYQYTVSRCREKCREIYQRLVNGLYVTFCKIHPDWNQEQIMKEVYTQLFKDLKKIDDH